MDLDRDGNSTEPSPRIWLGNIAPTATSKNLHAVLGRQGAAAVLLMSCWCELCPFHAGMKGGARSHLL